MSLNGLLQKYAVQSEATEERPSIPSEVSALMFIELPSDIGQWPSEWRWKLKENIDDLQGVFHLSRAEAQRASEACVRYEYSRQLETNAPAEGEVQ